MPFTVIPDAMVDVDSPVSTTLMTDLRDNDDWLKSALSDGSGASQGIDTSAIETSGDGIIGGDLEVNGGEISTLANILQFVGDFEFDGQVSIDGPIILTGVDLSVLNALIRTKGF